MDKPVQNQHVKSAAGTLRGTFAEDSTAVENKNRSCVKRRSNTTPTFSPQCWWFVTSAYSFRQCIWL